MCRVAGQGLLCQKKVQDYGTLTKDNVDDVKCKTRLADEPPKTMSE